MMMKKSQKAPVHQNTKKVQKLKMTKKMIKNTNTVAQLILFQKI